MRAFKSAASMALLLGIGAMAGAAPTASQAYIGVGISVNFAPPPLPYYDQPAIPGYGYMWTPGYWAWDPGVEDYYWVPGAWILPPRIGYLWTPAYWGWRDGLYVFNSGYWGPHIGFYGGINYGYGYNGAGYYGGEWRGRNFYYNNSVNNVRNINTSNIYTRNVTNYTTVNRVSYAGGPRGIQARPTPEQAAASREAHIGVTPMQAQHVQAARMQPSQRASFNHGAPPIAATARPGSFNGPGVVAARGASAVRPQTNGAGYRPGGPGGVPNGGPRPYGQQNRPYEGGRPANSRPDFANDRPRGPANSPYAEPRPNAQQNRPYQGGQPAYTRPAFANDRPGQDRSAPQMNRPFSPPPRSQAQFARPEPRPAMRPQPQARPAPQPARPAPEQRPAAPHEEHPHEERH